MSLLFNNNEISSLYYNGQEVNSVHLNGQEVWTSRLPAGLYDANDTMVYSWQELLDNGYLTNTNGQLNKGSNLSSLGGKLVISEDVTSIYSGSYSSRGVFANCTNFTEIDIPESVTSIGGYAFYGCSGLTKVTIPNSVTTIGTYAFYNCSNLTEITIPENLSTLNTYTFYNCKGVTKLFFNAINMPDLASSNSVFQYLGQSGNGVEVIFGSKVEHIPAYLFYPSLTSSYAPKIISITMGNSVVSIGNYMLYYGSELTSLTLSKNLQSVQSYSFYSLSNSTLKTLYFLGTLSEWVQLDLGNSNPIVYAENFYLAGGEQIPDEVIIEEGITKIAQRCLQGRSNITKIVIPSTVTSIGSYAFNKCSNLKELYWNAISVSDLSSYSRIFNNCGTAESPFRVVFGDQVTTIPANLFFDDVHLGELPKINEIILGKNVRSIGDHAFYRCQLITELRLPEKLESIGSLSFESCSGLTSIYIPASVTTISAASKTTGPFYYCNSSMKIYCGAASKPSGWGSYWYYYGSNNTLSYVFGYSFAEYDFFILGNKDNFEIINNMYYYSNENDNVALEVYDNTVTELEIPNKTTRISQNAFANCVNLQSLTIPENVSFIGASAFEGCTGLTEIYFNPTLLTSTNVAFRSVGTAGKDLTIFVGDNVTKLPSYCFSECRNATKIKFGNASLCSSIDYYAISFCSSLKYFIVPSKCQTIGNQAFRACSSMSGIFIPSSVTTINASSYSSAPFYLCSSTLQLYFEVSSKQSGWGSYYYYYNSSKYLTRNWNCVLADFILEICPEDLETTNINGINYFINSDDTYIAISRADENLTELNLDTKTVRIGREAFKGLSNVTSVTIPENVTRIDLSAFQDCSSISNINFNATNCSDLSSSHNIFKNSGTSSTTINIGSSVVSIPNYFLYSASAKVTTINWNNSLTRIGNYAFYRNYAATSIALPNSINIIGDCAFYQASLTAVSIPGGTIGASAFSNCPIKDLTLSEGVTTIGNYAFDNCPITLLDIPSSVTSISTTAFRYCSYRIQGITVSPTNTNYYSTGNCLIQTSNKYLLLGCETSSVPSDIVTLGQYAFSYCNFSSFTISSSVTKIDEYCFYNAFDGTAQIAIPGTCLTIEDGAFYSNGASKIGIAKLTINSGVQSIGAQAFQGHYNLSSAVTIPASVTSLGHTTFCECYNLPSINVQAAVEIPADFCSSTGITSVTLASGCTGIAYNAFYNCQNLKTVSVPSGNNITYIGSNAFQYCYALESFAFIANSTKLTRIEYEAFYSAASKPTSLTIPDSVTQVGDYAFSSLFSYYGDGTLVLGTGLTSFGAYAFGENAYFCKTITFRNTSYTWDAGGNTIDVSNPTTNVEHFANYNNTSWTRNG